MTNKKIECWFDMRYNQDSKKYTRIHVRNRDIFSELEEEKIDILVVPINDQLDTELGGVVMAANSVQKQYTVKYCDSEPDTLWKKLVDSITLSKIPSIPSRGISRATMFPYWQCNKS